ncbi:MAG: energy transducer TonB [Bacteroidales bacterium]|nr:energy transducer TonB [Bacteroidales bacterium]
METPKNLDEITFENRNKEYGAYYHRMVYKKYLTRSLAFTSTVVVLIILIVFFSSKNNTLNGTPGERNIIIILNPPPPPPPPVLPPPPPVKEKEIIKGFTPPVIADKVDSSELFASIEQVKTVPLQIESELTNDDFGNKKNDNVIPDDVTPPPDPVPSEMPEFKGGEEARFKFILDNIKYPKDAKEMGIEGKVFISFIVEKDGSLSNFKILRGIGGGCDEEALRVAKLMPKWIPGKQKGYAVRVILNMPIQFTLEKAY